MDTLVGGPYAEGYSADELAATFCGDGWGAIFRVGTARPEEAYRSKKQDDLYFSGDATNHLQTRGRTSRRTNPV